MLWLHCIDDVVNGERLLVDRPAKEFAYYTLRLKVCFQKMYHTISHCFTGSGPIGALREVTSLKARNFAHQGHVDCGDADQRPGG